MFVVELVMQGVRGIRELARLRFQSGFNLVSAGNESGKTTAVDTIQRLLFPNSQAGAMQPLVSRHTPDASRGALVICSDDGTYYRVIQDFRKQAVNLSRYNASSKEFNLLHKDWDGSTQFMAGLTTGVAEDDFAQVFVFRPEHAFGRPAPRATAASPALDDKPPSSAAAETTSTTQLAELRDALRKAEEAADAEYRYQSAKLALDELQKKLASLDEMERKKVEIESTLGELKGCEALPENLKELIESHERREAQKIADADSLNEELQRLKMRFDAIPPANFLTDKLFIAGAVLGLLSILAGVFVLTAEYEQYFPIGIILSLILIAVASYNASRKSAQRRAVRKGIEALEQEFIDLERKFVHESAPIAAYLRAVGAGSTAELREKTDNYRHFCSLRQDLEEGRQRILGDSSPELLRQHYERQQEEVRELEKAAREVAAFAVDTYSIRQDIERLEGESVRRSGPGFRGRGLRSGARRCVDGRGPAGRRVPRRASRREPDRTASKWRR